MRSRYLNGMLLAALLVVASCPAAGAAVADPAATKWHDNGATPEPGPGTDGPGPAMARAQQQHDRDRASQTTQAAGSAFAALAALAAGGAGIAACRRRKPRASEGACHLDTVAEGGWTFSSPDGSPESSGSGRWPSWSIL